MIGDSLFNDACRSGEIERASAHPDNFFNIDGMNPVSFLGLLQVYAPWVVAQECKAAYS